MAIEVTKDAIDLGIVVRDEETALAFYRDTLGLDHVASTPLPDGTMHRLMCGNSMIKLLVFDQVPQATNPPGGNRAATGQRYWTISVPDLQAIVDRCAAAGYAVPVPIREARPGVSIAMVEDPDGNWVEFLQETAG